MCEECENPNALHQTYAEKRKRISAVWKPVRKFAKPMIESAAATPAAIPAGDATSTSGRDD